jgi:Flp pilus assembly pilin Flp
MEWPYRWVSKNLKSLHIGITVALSPVEREHRTKEKRRRVMKIINKLRDQRGQGLMEYTLVVFLVALVFWGGMKGTNIGDELAVSWSKVIDCISTPFSCGS